MKPFILLLALAFAVPAAAAPDTLLIQRVEATQGLNMPSRGQSMAQVEAQFGAPQHKSAPVGSGTRANPPITRWNYPAYTVYFEHSHVIKAVLNRSNPDEIGPKPTK